MQAVAALDAPGPLPGVSRLPFAAERNAMSKTLSLATLVASMLCVQAAWSGSQLSVSFVEPERYTDASYSRAFAVERELRKRRFGTAVRLEVAASMPGEMVRFLASSLRLSADDVYTIDGPLNMPDLMALYKLDHPGLKDKPLVAATPPAFATGEPMFDVIKRQDVLVHHPYNSFAPVIDFINAAANDPSVQAIKMTLYRTGPDSPVVKALMAACEKGKQVAVLVELKARFDEESNIEWARRLERVGVVLVIVAAGVVVLDLQVAVAPQALRDHEIVRLVARGEERRSGEPLGGEAGGRRRGGADRQREGGHVPPRDGARGDQP